MGETRENVATALIVVTAALAAALGAILVANRVVHAAATRVQTETNARIQRQQAAEE